MNLADLIKHAVKAQDTPPEKRVEWIKAEPDRFYYCLGCDRINPKRCHVCAFCSSYRFIELSEGFLANLTPDAFCLYTPKELVATR